MPYPSKTPEAQREYRLGIPKELKKIYQNRYYATEKWKETKKRKNSQYRLKKKILSQWTMFLQPNTPVLFVPQYSN